MKRFLMLVAVAAVAGAMYVAAAPGSQQATGPTERQFTTLKRQVASLSKKLKALKADEAKVKANATSAAGFIVDCFLSTNAGAAPASQFGDRNGTYGFAYKPTAVASTTVPRTALDLDSSTTPQGFLQTVDPSCITASSAAAPAQTHSSSGRLPTRAETR